jgi:amino acid transporter
MSSTNTPQGEHQLRKGSLGVLGIAFFVISAAAPLTAMAGGAPVAMLLGNGAGIPFAYVIVAVLLLIFAVGYTAMARHHTSTGAFYSYVARGLGQRAGGIAALIALLGYNAMQIGLYGLFGAAASGFMEAQFGVAWPWWSYVLIAGVIIGFLGYRQVDLSVKVLGVLVAAEFLIVVVLDLAVIIKGGQGGGAGLSMSSFSMDSLMSGSLAIALLFNSASFIGFEATTIYSEEARDPKRTVPRATYAAVLTIGLFYTVTTWLMVNAQGADGLVDHIGGLTPDPTAFLFEISGIYLGELPTTIMTVLFATSVFAALLAFHNAVARYFFALGREGLLPTPLGHTHKIHLSPHKGSVSSRSRARGHRRLHRVRPGPRAGPVHLAHPVGDLGHPRPHGPVLGSGHPRSSPATRAWTPTPGARRSPPSSAPWPWAPCRCMPRRSSGSSSAARTARSLGRCRPSSSLLRSSVWRSPSGCAAPLRSNTPQMGRHRPSEVGLIDVGE